MKINIKDTNLVDKELEKKIRKELKDKVQEFDENRRYTMDLQFSEDFIICESEIDSYKIPKESLPPYQRGKELKGKEKMYALLSYRIHTVINIVKEYGIRLGNSGIKGMPFMESNKIELCFSEEDVQLDNKCKRKKDKGITVIAVMPSFSGFIKNLEFAFKDIENRIEKDLENVFDDKKEYDKYNELLDKFELYNILSDFKKEYGDMWMYSREHKSELKKKFIETIEIKAGIVPDDILKEQVLRPLKFKTVVICEIPVCKIIKKNTGVNKCIGHIRLLTNGRIINVKYQPHSKPYVIPDEVFEECIVSVTSRNNNKKLLKIIEELVNKVDEICQRFGYVLEKDIIHNVIGYMDIKSVIKKAREA
ncbi:hypothetical protein DP130_03220 [Clostridium tetani]|uniref:Uncharacterized protein n=1 Tax=Clostridium tetani TaxID=1513 RepID=A0A4Q0VDF3_CLOTA|nr:hypothetical protein [Clostridium tetani]RXI50002.1 hypothetical protein DP130_03220 [Clostridium tetani]